MAPMENEINWTPDYGAARNMNPLGMVFSIIIFS